MPETGQTFDDGGKALSTTPQIEPSYWNGPRRELIAWFDERAPHLAGMYRAGVMLLRDESIPDRGRLIAHIVREIGNRLPNVFGITRVTGTPRLVRQLVKTWQQCGLPTDLTATLNEGNPAPGNVPTYSIPQPAARAIGELLQDEADAEGRALEHAILLFREISPEARLPVEQLRPTALKWVAVLKWFRKRAHIPEEPLPIQEDELRGNFEIFEALLGSMLRPFFSTLKDVDEILEEANS